ncbi:POTRA domain-containing protein, partial [Methylobacterium sp. J-068]|uniref:POTRA domain-containing protein n=1 Tax=Methylobacterium sp. J-068 TaxID=2836649 RepID=UPI002444DF11
MSPTRVRAVRCLIGAGFLAIPSAGHAAETVVEGNRRVEADVIRSIVASAPDAPRRALQASGYFSEVTVASENGRTVIRVREKASINRVVFEGNKKVEIETLKAAVVARDRSPFDPAQVTGDIERIRALYKQAGRGSAKVTYRTVDLPNGRLDVIYVIEEGDKTGIKAINFVGNQAYSESKLRELMSSSEMN